MALAVTGLVASGETLVQDVGCIADSFPGFEATLARLREEPKISQKIESFREGHAEAKRAL
jgi:UDP-N-acetylglucosamine enolpyruvyl transferase